MWRVGIVGVSWWAIACGNNRDIPIDAPTFCDYRGMRYDIGESFRDECNGCSCGLDSMGAATVTCTLKGCCSSSDECYDRNRCGDTCCKTGEFCFEGACLCGVDVGEACGVGERCAPIEGPFDCGRQCCGVDTPCE